MIARFRCAGDAWYENEVEKFITEDLASEIPGTGQLAGTLLILRDGDLVAVAAHKTLEIEHPLGTASGCPQGIYGS